MNNTHEAISHLCAELGKDRLLVQGAGGNVSWKESGVLWIKGSGTWLANADKEDIFVQVDLNQLQNALSQENFEVKPHVIDGLGGQKLRPSIETVLHALMPQKIVVHLHAINALSHLVIKDCKTSIQKIFTKSSDAHKVNSVFVDYHKPGPELAQGIYKALQENTAANVAFLKNHGIVIGAESVEAIYALLKSINTVCAQKQNYPSQSYIASSQGSGSNEYILFPDEEAQTLALDPDLYKRLQHDWILFPDHAVFLGPKAFLYDSWADFLSGSSDCKPEIIFIKHVGVFIKPNFNQAKRAQLLCYYDVLSRISADAILDPLDPSSVNALLNWDAEQYRIHIAK